MSMLPGQPNSGSDSWGPHKSCCPRVMKWGAEVLVGGYLWDNYCLNLVNSVNWPHGGTSKVHNWLAEWLVWNAINARDLGQLMGRRKLQVLCLIEFLDYRKDMQALFNDLKLEYLICMSVQYELSEEETPAYIYICGLQSILYQFKLPFHKSHPHTKAPLGCSASMW